MKHLLLAWLAAIAVATPLFAAGEREIQFRTLCLGQVEGLEKVLLAGEGGGRTEVPLYTEISPPIQAEFKSNEAVFYTEKTDPDGRVVVEPVGRATFGKSAKQMFLFVPGGGGGGRLPYRVIAYDDDLATFAPGTIRVINLSPVPVRFVLSGAVIPPVPPAKYAQFPHSKKVDEYNMYPVAVEFLSAGGDWIKGQSVSWKATDNRRDIVVTLVDREFKQPTVQMFSDVPPQDVPAARVP